MIYNGNKMITYIKIQYPIINKNMSRLLCRHIELILLKSCSSCPGANVMRKSDFISEPVVYYIIDENTDTVHGECLIEYNGMVTYKICDGFEQKVDGFIKINLVHGIAEFSRLEKSCRDSIKRVAFLFIAGIVLFLIFVLSLFFGDNSIVKGAIFGSSFCCMLSAYINFRYSIGSNIKRMNR